MAHIESTAATRTNTNPSWADEEMPAYSVPPPPANRHIGDVSIDVSETARQFVKYGESHGIRSLDDRRRLLRLFDDFKANSGVDNRDEFSRVLFELSRNQKLLRVVGGTTIEWNDSSTGSATRRVSSSRPIERPRDTRDTRDTRDRDFNRPERPSRDNYERDYVRHERHRDNEDPRDRRIIELTRTIISMEQTIERLQNRLDSGRDR